MLSEEVWYRNFLKKGFHPGVLLASGPGIRDTQAISLTVSFFYFFVLLFSF